MVTMVRRGAPLRAVARRRQVSLHTVQRWVARAAGQRLDRIDWADRPPIARTIHRTDPETEALVSCTYAANCKSRAPSVSSVRR